MSKETQAINHLRDMAAMLLLMAITLFVFSLTIAVESTAGLFSLIGMLLGGAGIGGGCVFLWLAKQAIDRS